jgi:hypothetical protein
MPFSGTGAWGGGASGSGGNGGGGGGWMDWLLPLLGAAGGYFGAQQQNKPTTSTGSQNSTTTNSPYGPAGPLVNLGLGAALDNFLNFRPRKPPGAGIGKDTNAMLGKITGMANGGSPFLDPASDFYGSIFSDPMGNNQLREMLVGGLGQDLPYVDDFIGATTGMGGQAGEGFMGGSSALLGQLFKELGMGGEAPGFDGSGRASMGGRGGGGFSASSSGGGSLQGSDLWPYLQATLNGEWLGEGNPHNAALLDNIRRESAEGYKQGVVPQIDAQYQRAGRYGSGAYQQAQVGANEEYNEALQGTIANVLSSTHQFERGNMQDALMGGLGEETSRMATSAAAGGNAASLALQEQIANMGNRRDLMGLASGLLGGLGDFSQGNNSLGLSAMGLLSDDRLGRLGLLSGQASDLDGLRLGALGLAPDLDAARYYGPLNALGAMGQRDSRQSAAANSRWRYESELPFRMLNEFMGTVMPIATSFGTTTSNGTSSNTQQGAGINQWGALLQGLLGGAMANRGMTGRQ